MTRPTKYPFQRAAVAAAVFLPLLALVVLIQVLLDDKTKDWTSARGSKAVLITLALVYGSAAYDGAKRAFFLTNNQFVRFRNSITNLYSAVCAVVVCCVAMAATFQFAAQVPWAVSSLYFVVAVTCIPWLVRSLMAAFESAASEA